MFKNKQLDPIEFLVNGKRDFEIMPIEFGIYAIEKIQQNQEVVQVNMDIGFLSKSISINTDTIQMEQSMGEWRIYFGKHGLYDLAVCNRGVNKTPVNINWFTETNFSVLFSKPISDLCNMTVVFFGDIGELTKEEYFKK